MLGVITFSITEQLIRWASGYTDHASIEYYLKSATFRHDPSMNTIFIEWPQYYNGRSIGAEAQAEFPILYRAINETNQENIFPSWLDSYNIAAQYGPTVTTFRSPLACRNCPLKDY